jgi:hypothetical protein
MTRILQPELLDTLPAENPEAARSRADLRRVNAWMGHRRILLRALQSAPLANVRRIVELGAGDGTLALALATTLHTRWPQVELTLVDQQRLVAPETLEKFRHLSWSALVVQADAFDWLAGETEPADIIFANLFVHHFEETALRRLLRETATRCSCFIALEPRRHFTARLGCELLRVIGCNRVTRHDARLSVRAGFRGQELSSLWPNSDGWTVREQRAGMFSHLFVATRTST